jgi:hypothetical protein
VTKFSHGFNWGYNLTMNQYCRLAINFYDPAKVRTLRIPFRVSLQDIFGDNEEIIASFAEAELDLKDTEYRNVMLANVDPEIYYFFKYYYSNRISAFEQMLTACNIYRRDRYTADLINDINGRTVEFIFDEDSGTIVAIVLPTSAY